MARRNIFDILSEKNDIHDELVRIENFLKSSSVDGQELEEIIDEYCFKDWKARGRNASCEEVRNKLGINQVYIYSELIAWDEEHVLYYLEYISNLIWLCEQKYEDNDTEYDKEYDYLKESVLALVEDLGYEARVFEDEEKVLLVEKDAAMTAVAEIVKPELAYEVIEYNHHSMKGDIAGKQKILKVLADEFEPKREELKKINKELESNTGYLLNKMNIRHNNIDGKNAIEYVKNLSDEQLEEWYDETYQMLLLCLLEYDNIKRNEKVNELKKMIEK